MSLINNFRPEEPKTYIPPKEGWQRVQCINYKEDKTKTGKDRITIDIRTEDGIKVKYAYSIIGGSEYTNANITGLFYAFGVNLNSAIPSFVLIKNAWAIAYIHKTPNSQGKEYWGVRNWRYTNQKGETIETWYPTGKKSEKPKQDEQIDDSFSDDVALF